MIEARRPGTDALWSVTRAGGGADIVDVDRLLTFAAYDDGQPDVLVRFTGSS